jgi:hypothetical protein
MFDTLPTLPKSPSSSDFNKYEDTNFYGGEDVDVIFDEFVPNSSTNSNDRGERGSEIYNSNELIKKESSRRDKSSSKNIGSKSSKTDTKDKSDYLSSGSRTVRSKNSVNPSRHSSSRVKDKSINSRGREGRESDQLDSNEKAKQKKEKKTLSSKSSSSQQSSYNCRECEATFDLTMLIQADNGSYICMDCKQYASMFEAYGK